MAIPPPQMFHISGSSDDLPSLPSEVWKISSPPKNSLYWSLILSYVILSEKIGSWQNTGYNLLLGNAAEIEDVMKKKNIKKKPDRNCIRNRVLGFNPFKHRFSIYYNDDLRDVLRIFELRLNRFASKTRKRGDTWDETLKLKAASKMLQCQIVIVTQSSGTHEVDTYRESSQSGSPQMIIFRRQIKVDNDEKTIFAFGMSLTHSVHLRREALSYILKKAKVSSEDISKIRNNYQIESDFLLYLLSSKSYQIIPSIYRSPYIAWKLEGAGFNTDPCRVDEKNRTSAFYHCVGLTSTRIFYTLYNYSVNNFQNTDDESIRDPSNAILDCLKRVGCSIKQNFLISNGFSRLGERKDAANEVVRDMLLLNEYQTCVVEEVCAILHTTDSEITQRKRIVISVLNNYFRHFNHPVSSSFDNHVEFGSYLQNMDNYTCLMFFDKVLSLSPVGESSNFRNTVLYLFLTVISYKVFPKCKKHGSHCSKCPFTIDNSALRFISYNYRKHFEEAGKLYMAELQNDTSESLKDSDVIISSIRSSLKDCPEITDEFLIKRLATYLKATKNLNLDSDFVKASLVIERTMQVIGETLVTSPVRKSVIGHLLNACLPNDVAHELFLIRNSLSHYRASWMQSRIRLLKDKDLFKTLQNVLAKLDDVLEPVYISQDFRIEQFLISENKMDSKKISETVYKSIETKVCEMKIFAKGQYSNHKTEYRRLANNVIDYIQRSIGSNNFKNAPALYETLNFVFSFIGKNCDTSNSQEIVKYLNLLETLMVMDIKDESKEAINSNILLLKSVFINIFKDIKLDDKITIPDSSHLHDYYECLVKSDEFSDAEITCIRTEVQTYLSKSNESIKYLKEQIENKQPMTVDRVEELLKTVCITDKNKKIIEGEFQNNPERVLKTFKTIKNIEVFNNFQELIVFSSKEEGRRALLDITLPSSDLGKKLFRFLHRNLECLLDRIGHLKEILIEEDEEISALWKWGKSKEIRRHTRFLMGQRYMKEREVRAAMEMLLFDCMNILKDRTDLSHLWTKSTHMFSGACLRDVLSHGSTVLETVGGVLDPDDLPTQLIDKVMELIEDSEALRAMSDLLLETKPLYKKQLEERILEVGVGNRMTPEARILKCQRWKAYLSLLPLK